MGLTLLDHVQPGSKTALPMILSPTLTTSAFPFPSKGRVSSGESKFLTSPAIRAPFVNRVLAANLSGTGVGSNPRASSWSRAGGAPFTCAGRPGGYQGRARDARRRYRRDPARQ